MVTVSDDDEYIWVVPIKSTTELIPGSLMICNRRLDDTTMGVSKNISTGHLHTVCMELNDRRVHPELLGASLGTKTSQLGLRCSV